MGGEHWYYRLDGKPHGPFTATQFEKLIRGRTVAPDTEVSTDGKAWQTLRQAMAGVPADAPVAPEDWMTAPTLVPGDVRLPPGWKDPPPPDPAG